MAAPSNDPGPGGMIVGINVTPFVDIVLVLLIIFMVMAKWVVNRQATLPVTLPQSASGEEVQHLVSVVLTREGQIQLNGAPLADDAAFDAAIDREHQANPELKVVIHADGEVPHRKVVHVMDLLARRKIHRIGFGVQR